MAEPQLPAIGEPVPSGFGALPPIGGVVSGLDQPDETGRVRVAIDEPNTLGTFASHLGQQINPVGLGQLLPFPAAAGGGGMPTAIGGQGTAIGRVFQAQTVPLDHAKASYAQGDYGGAAIHLLNYLLPVIGPILDKSGNDIRAGHYAAGLGDAIGLGMAIAGPKAVEARMGGPAAGMVQGPEQAVPGLSQRPPGVRPGGPVNPVDAAAVQFGQRAGIPLDAGAATGNKFIQGVQAVADRSPLGSRIADTAIERQRVALGATGEGLANSARETSITPELAGQGVKDALASKVEAHTALADSAYERLRAAEADPTNQMAMPTAPTPVDALSDNLTGQVRRIVHELDAMPFTKRLLQPTEKGGGLEPVEGTGGAGAKVFDDIKARMSLGANPTRGVMQAQLETYLGGGPETSIVKAALDVAAERNRGQGGRTVAMPELPASAMDHPTRLEASRPALAEMGLPVILTDVKLALRPIYEQMKRQMPVTQQQASGPLKAIENILTSPNYAPLSQVDRDLSAIKQVARTQGGIAKLAVAQLDAAVQQAAANGGEVLKQTLQQGRAATVGKYATSDVLDTLPDEPVKVFKQLTAPKDASIDQLRAVTQQVPHVAPQLARAVLEERLAELPDKAAAEWNKLGRSTRQILFPKPGLSQALDQFFRVQQMVTKNVNPSGSGHQAGVLGQVGAGMFGLGQLAAGHPVPLIAFLAGELTMGGLAKLLHSPGGVRAVTRAVQLSGPSIPPSAQAAALAQIAAAAQAEGLTMNGRASQ